MDKKLTIILTTPLIALILGITISLSAKFEPFLSPAEKQILAFSQQKIKISYRQPVPVTSLPNPVPIEVPTIAFPKVPIDKLAPSEAKAEEKEEKKVSLILINNSRKIAIINGIIVNEGDSIDSMRVEKIEKGRILLKDKVWAKWIMIE